mmetsp:Transcript_80973/g.128080  ORF Transcript_80973/g.128080 Transcript_80973/m.128080 type:complete len:357 (+) Transcript_80973:121-1191(+)
MVFWAQLLALQAVTATVDVAVLGHPEGMLSLLRRERSEPSEPSEPSGLVEDMEDPQEVEMEAEAEEAASTLSSGLRNASAKVFADEHGESTEMIHEDPPLEDPQNVTLLEGAAGRPALIVSGMYGPAGAMGERGPAGPQGLQGPMGPAGASVIGPTGSQGTPGQQGKVGKTGKVGLKGHAGSQGEPGKPCEEFYKWSQLLDYYSQVVSKMEAQASTHVRGINREVSMLQQQSAIYTARSFALSNGSVDLHNYMVANYKRMVKSASSAKEVDEYLARMSMVTPMDALHEAQRLYPAFVGTQRVASVMQAQSQHQGQFAARSHIAAPQSGKEKREKSDTLRSSLSVMLMLAAAGTYLQ